MLVEAPFAVILPPTALAAPLEAPDLVTLARRPLLAAAGSRRSVILMLAPGELVLLALLCLVLLVGRSTINTVRHLKNSISILQWPALAHIGLLSAFSSSRY